MAIAMCFFAVYSSGNVFSGVLDPDPDQNVMDPEHWYLGWKTPVSEFIDPVFAKTSPKRSSSISENEHFGIVFAKTGSINLGTGMVLLSGLCYLYKPPPITQKEQ
jgi:hypothetical protein